MHIGYSLLITDVASGQICCQYEQLRMHGITSEAVYGFAAIMEREANSPSILRKVIRLARIQCKCGQSFHTQYPKPQMLRVR